VDVRWREGLSHPLGVTLLTTSGLLAALMVGLPALATWSDRSFLMLLLGIGAYGASAAVAARWPPSPAELARLRAARQEIARLLVERRGSASGAVRPEWDRLASEALTTLDEDIAPALAQLLARREYLARHLGAFDRGIDRGADPVLLDTLRGDHARDIVAVATGLKGVVNAEVTLIGLLVEGEGAVVADGLRRWVADLVAVHAALAVALERRPLPTPCTVPPTTAEALPEDELERPSLEPLVTDALRHLNRYDVLARCELAVVLPRSLDADHNCAGEGPETEATPMERARVLHDVLVEAIERLKPVQKEATEQALPYDILREEYVLGMSTKRIIARHNISEATLHRRRRDGIRAIAAELSMQDRRLSQRDRSADASPG
jgi:hypothetical protein